ncbi:MAG TPA: hypothetical protein VFF12_18705, partial [Myxococcaceae bacterium]|nr:hypothetical protein [Myxococcaceae bacterium]
RLRRARCLMSGEELIPVFAPNLADVLASREREKGDALTEGEIEQIRDAAVCIMLAVDDAREMERARGYVDVDPDDCWADWHRLRPQLMGRYLPKIVLCTAGDARFAERAEAFLAKQSVRHEVRGREPRLEEAFTYSQCRRVPSFDDADWDAIRAHSHVVFAVSQSVKPDSALAIARRLLQIGARLLDSCGGVAMKCESSGIAHGRERWLELATSASAERPAVSSAALVESFVQFPIGEEDEYWTCGMHLLGWPDLILAPRILGSDRPDVAGADFFDTLAHYLVVECARGVGGRRFRSGNCFRTTPDGVLLRGKWEPCQGYEEDSFFHNPFGRLRFSLP